MVEELEQIEKLAKTERKYFHSEILTEIRINRASRLRVEFCVVNLDLDPHNSLSLLKECVICFL